MTSWTIPTLYMIILGLTAVPVVGLVRWMRRQRRWLAARPPAAVDQFDLINLIGVDIASLTGPGDDSVLAHALRRVLEDVDRPGDAVAGWNAAIG